MAEGRSYTTTFKTKAETQGISEMQKKLQDLQKSLKDNQTEQKALSKEVKDAEKEIKQIEKTIAKTGETTEEQRKRLEQLKATIEADRENVEKLKLQEAQLRSEMEETNRKIEAERKALTDLKTSMSDAKSAAGELTKEVAAIGAAATAAVAGLFAFTKDAAQWADDINTLSKTTGISTAELQKFTYATDLIDVSVDTLSGSLTKLTRNMSTAAESSTSSAAEAFRQLGIAVTDSTGQLRDRETVFYEVIDALGQMTNETQRDAVAMDIFGKSAQQLNPLIKGGAEALKEIGAEAEKAGLILSQDTLNSLNAFNDKVDELKAKGTAIKELAAAEMIPALEGLVEVGDELLAEIQQMVKSGELRSMAKELGVAIKNGAEALKNIIGFVWQYKEAIGAAVVGMVAFKAAMSITALINSLVVGFKALSVATQSETTSMAALNTVMKANPIGLVISAVAALATGLGVLAAATGQSQKSFKNYNEELERLLAQEKDVEANAIKEGKSVQLLKDEYDRLREKTSLTAYQKEKLNNVAQQLATTLGLTTDKIRTQEGAYRDLTAEVDNYAERLKEQAKLKYYTELVAEAYTQTLVIQDRIDKLNAARLKALATDGQAAMSLFWDEIGDLNKQLKDAESAYEDAKKKYDQLNKSIEAGADALGGYASSTETAKKSMEDLAKESNSLRSEMNSLANSLKQLESGEALSLNTLLDLIDKYPEYTDELIAAAGNADLQRSALEHLFEAKKQEYILSLERASSVSRASNEETAIVLDNLAKQMEAYNSMSSVMGNVALAAVVSNKIVAGLLKSQAQELRNTVSTYEREIEFVKNLKIGDFVTTSGGTSGTAKSAAADKKNTLTSPHTWNYKGETYTAEYSYTEGEYDAVRDADTNAKAYLGVLDRVKNFGKLTLGEEISNLQTILKWEKLSGDQRYEIRLRLYKAETELAKKTAEAEEAADKEAADRAKKAADEAAQALLERQNMALAAYNKLVNGRIEALEAESQAAQDNEESEDAKRQQELDQINAKLKYQQLDEFERLSLERRRQDILNEQTEVRYERMMEGRKAMITGTAEAIQNKNAQAIAGLQASQTQAADRVAYLQGNQTYDQRVKNNTVTQNVTVVQNGLSGDQLIKKLLKELGAI